MALDRREFLSSTALAGPAMLCSGTAALAAPHDALNALFDTLFQESLRQSPQIATTLGLEFDPDKSWDEKKEVYRLSNQIVRTQNVTQTAVGDKKGWWTTVVAAAVLVG